MKNFFNIINGDFLNNLEIRPDETGNGVKEFILLKDRKDIEKIITASKYKNLSEDEAIILKKMYISMIKYNDLENINFLKKKIEELLKLSNDELLSFFLRNKFPGLFEVETFFFNKEMYIGISESKNNISNSTHYQDSNFIQIYKDIIKSIMNLYIPVDDKIIEKIVNFEIKLNESKLEMSEKRNIKESVNIFKISSIKFLNFNLEKLIKLLLNGIKYLKDEIIIDSKEPFKYYRQIDTFLKDPDFKYYLIWCILNETSTYTFGRANDYKFELLKITRGIKKKNDFDKKKIDIMNLLLGHLISKEYYSLIDSKIKPRMYKLISYLKKSFKDRLKENKWMDSETKIMALEKLDKMSVDIGEGELIDFNSMKELSILFLENFLIINEYLFNNSLKLLEKYKKIYIGNIYEINAYYSPTTNQMAFPFGILRPPYFYNKNWSSLNAVAYNFGAIGSVIGHELIHGFDDQGRLFDKDGNLKNWWKKESEDKYNEISKKIGELYSKDGMNPELTMGENIADIGGVRISLTALELYLRDINQELTKDLINMFIRGWSMIWRQKKTKEEAQNRIMSDPHSKPELRVNIPLNNLKEVNQDNKNIIELW